MSTTPATETAKRQTQHELVRATDKRPIFRRLVGSLWVSHIQLNNFVRALKSPTLLSVLITTTDMLALPAVGHDNVTKRKVGVRQSVSVREQRLDTVELYRGLNIYQQGMPL